jgi:hypothetical protein
MCVVMKKKSISKELMSCFKCGVYLNVFVLARRLPRS